MSFRNGFYAGLVVAAIWGVYLVRLWQPQRQIELHSRHLVEQIEEEDWKAVEKFIGEGYRDRWGHDRAFLLERLRQIFRALSNTKIEATNVSVQTGDGRGSWTAKFTLKATGEFASVIEGHVNSVEAPFELEWQRGATWPWDWKLVSVQNPGFEIPDYSP